MPNVFAPLQKYKHFALCKEWFDWAKSYYQLFYQSFKLQYSKLLQSRGRKALSLVYRQNRPFFRLAIGSILYFKWFRQAYVYRTVPDIHGGYGENARRKIWIEDVVAYLDRQFRQLLKNLMCGPLFQNKTIDDITGDVLYDLTDSKRIQTIIRDLIIMLYAN